MIFEQDPHYLPMPPVAPMRPESNPYKVHFGVTTPLNKMNCEYTLKDNDMAIAVFSEMQRIIEKYLSQGEDSNDLH